MSATDELRALLDERGVEWSERESAFRYQTFWKGAHSIPCSASERVEGGLLVVNMHVDPNEAVEVTLGRGTCHVESSIIDTYEYNRWEYVLDCGHTIIWEDSEPPSFCPDCGRKVER